MRQIEKFVDFIFMLCTCLWKGESSTFRRPFFCKSFFCLFGHPVWCILLGVGLAPHEGVFTAIAYLGTTCFGYQPSPCAGCLLSAVIGHLLCQGLQ